MGVIATIIMYTIEIGVILSALYSDRVTSVCVRLGKVKLLK